MDVETAAPELSTEATLLTEIRDLLREQADDRRRKAEKPPDVFEYCIANCHTPEQLTAQSNALGANRWEMCGAGESHGFPYGLFKRTTLGEGEDPMIVNRTGAGVYDLNPPVDPMPPKNGLAAPV